FFSFSSRRRHTRWPRDWSSDVCFFRSCAHPWNTTGPPPRCHRARRQVQVSHAAEKMSSTETDQLASAGNATTTAREVRLPITRRDRKSKRLNSSHVAISYDVFCLKTKN